MKSVKEYDIVAIGSAVVDISAKIDDAFLSRHGLKKGASNPVSAEQQADMLKEIEQSQLLKTCGGPCANVTIGISANGGESALTAKVGRDENGVFFSHRVNKHGVDFMPSLGEGTTTTILCATTPDGERTFAAAVGHAHVTAEDIDIRLIRQSRVVYVDSYFWSLPGAEETFTHAARLANDNDCKVAIALNDVAHVTKNRDKMQRLAKICKEVVLVGDQHEFAAFFGVTDTGQAVMAANGSGWTSAITKGKQGAIVVHGGEMHRVPAQAIQNVVDTNGAGDQFAAGFLYGIGRGMSPQESARLGTEWAAKIIQHAGAEPRPHKMRGPKIR